MYEGRRQREMDSGRPTKRKVKSQDKNLEDG